MTDVQPTFRCPFCHELCRPNAGGADLRNRDQEHYYRETEHTYECTRGHRFSRIEMVTGVRAAERKTA